MPSGADWVESLTPWPAEFGLDRMHALLETLGNPERSFRAVHVVGTNGKSTATRTIEALLLAEELSVGAYLSPHVRGWSERIRVDGEEADFERALARVRPASERAGATQFEVLTAAALLAFAEAGVDAAVVEAGLGGRHDATNVLDAPVVLLTNVGLDHTDVLGATRSRIAREKLAVVRPGATAVLPDDEFAPLVPHARVVVGGAREAASAFLGRDAGPVPDVALPGRLEERVEGELWDGAHNAEGVAWLAERLPRRDYAIVASILADKDVDLMLERLAEVGDRLIATRSSNPRALEASELAARARRHFADVIEIADPETAVATARNDPPVLVTGSLYLLADLASLEEQRIK
jgi:dihydrofolate synthase / folylpolyglutamate synthase